MHLTLNSLNKIINSSFYFFSIYLLRISFLQKFQLFLNSYLVVFYCLPGAFMQMTYLNYLPNQPVRLVVLLFIFYLFMFYHYSSSIIVCI